MLIDARPRVNAVSTQSNLSRCAIGCHWTCTPTPLIVHGLCSPNSLAAGYGCTCYLVQCHSLCTRCALAGSGKSRRAVSECARNAGLSHSLSISKSLGAAYASAHDTVRSHLSLPVGRVLALIDCPAGPTVFRNRSCVFENDGLGFRNVIFKFSARRRPSERPSKSTTAGPTGP